MRLKRSVHAKYLLSTGVLIKMTHHISNECVVFLSDCMNVWMCVPCRAMPLPVDRMNTVFMFKFQTKIYLWNIHQTMISVITSKFSSLSFSFCYHSMVVVLRDYGYVMRSCDIFKLKQQWYAFNMMCDDNVSAYLFCIFSPVRVCVYAQHTHICVYY